MSNVRASSFKALKYAFLLVSGTVEGITWVPGSVFVETIFVPFSLAESVFIGFLVFPLETNPGNKKKITRRDRPAST